MSAKKRSVCPDCKQAPATSYPKGRCELCHENIHRRHWTSEADLTRRCECDTVVTNRMRNFPFCYTLPSPRTLSHTIFE
jgi:hypothetical protein